MSSPLVDQDTVLLWLFDDPVNSTSSVETVNGINLGGSGGGLVSLPSSQGGHIVSGGVERNYLHWTETGTYGPAVSPAVSSSQYLSGTAQTALLLGATTGTWTYDTWIAISGTPFTGSNSFHEYNLFQIVSFTGTTNYGMQATLSATSNGAQPSFVNIYQAGPGPNYTQFLALSVPYTASAQFQALTVRRYGSTGSWTYDAYIGGVFVTSSASSNDVSSNTVGLPTTEVIFSSMADVDLTRFSTVQRTAQEIADWASLSTTLYLGYVSASRYIEPITRTVTSAGGSSATSQVVKRRSPSKTNPGTN